MVGSSLVCAQSLRDKVIVELPYRVTLNDKATLEPGQYTINQTGDSGGGRYVLQIRKDDIEHEALVQSIPATDNNTKEDTRVMLHKLSDGSYMFDKIWVQGKDYGYEFPLPDAIRDRERERMTSSAITARYEPGKDATQEGQPAQTAEERSKAAITDQSGTTASTPAQPVNPTTTETDTEAARAASPADTAANQPGSDRVAAQPQTQQPDVTGNQPAETQVPRTTPGEDVAPEELPQTAANWLTMLTAGLSLMGGGLALRRRN
jgi:LPXTG-motif cell wall-anchored protein